MFKHVMIVTTLCLLPYPCVAWPQTGEPVKVALLPMQQEQTNGSRVSDEELSAALLAELTKTGEFQLVESARLEEAFEEELIDDAVFELLVTDNLTQTLDRLGSFSSTTGRRSVYETTARRLGAGLMVEVTFDKRRSQTEVNYRLTDINTSRVARAQSFVTSLGGSRDLAREAAKRVTRDLWKLKHRSEPAK